MDVQQRVREHVLETHRDLLDTVLTCADEVAGSVSLPADRRVVTTHLDRALREAGAFAGFVAIVKTAADAMDADLPAEPVAAPPNVVVTGRGPMVRVTVDAGRVLVLIRAFELTAEGYVRADLQPIEAVEVTFHAT